MSSLKIWVVAGESSGDSRAYELMRAIHAAEPGVQFVGAGGPRMAGLSQQPFDNWISKAAVVGLVDVLRHYGFFRKKFRGMLEEIERSRPEAVMFVDYPGFNLRLAKALRKRGYAGKILYYISPQVWAWNRGRIPKMAKILDLMICVFPFEEPMYEASVLHTVFAGHPLLEALLAEKSEKPREADLLGLFPGSRKREVYRIFPAQLATANRVARQRPRTQFEVAAASEAHASWIREQAGDFPLKVTVGNAHDLMQRATAGIVCSGTATLEAAFFGLPYCLVYKAAWLTFELGHRLVSVDCLGIINILNNYQTNPPPDPRLPAKSAPHIVREFIQHFATPEAMAEEALRLLDDTPYRTALTSKFQKILTGLQAEGASQRAASAILAELR
ncbi:MAG: lipid-A-disaccharide synthase [Terrimicrobiaceae bacterium]